MNAALLSVKNKVEEIFPCAAGSKYIRSKIALLCLNESTQVNIDFLAAIELIHNASLLHDDVIDQEAVRRGSAATPIITGDYLLAKAMQLVPSSAVRSLAKTLENMCLGEFAQLEARGKQITLEQYLLKTQQKTAGLFVAAFEGCGLQVEFAQNFGMLFQIKNDLVDKQKDCEIGLFNPVTTELLSQYHIQTLASIPFLDDNKQKQELEELINETVERAL
jgi:geranylgeranyl pyrophosphate synthase